MIKWKIVIKIKEITKANNIADKLKPAKLSIYSIMSYILSSIPKQKISVSKYSDS